MIERPRSPSPPRASPEDEAIVYIIDDDRKIVSITRVAHRRDVYE